MNEFDFKDRTAVITGGGQGFGLDIAKRFLNSGAKVIIWDIDEKLLKSAIDEVNNSNLSYNVVDVSNYKQIEKTVSDITAKSNIDILINNAGITGPTAPLWEYDVEMWNKIVQINLVGTFNCCRAIVPNMIQNNYGRIVNVASVAASFGLPGIASYCASKFAMLGFSEGLKHELSGTGVGITVVSPIMVKTDFFDHPSFEKMPKYSPTSLNSKTVAKAIVKAANSSRLEIITPSVVRIAVWLKHTFPYFINPILGKSFKKQLESTKVD